MFPKITNLRFRWWSQTASASWLAPLNLKTLLFSTS